MAEELPDLVTAEEGALVLVFAAAGGGGGGGVCHGRNWPFGLNWVFIIFGALLLLFSSLLLSFFFVFWGCSRSLAQFCFRGVGCEFGLKYRPIK